LDHQPASQVVRNDGFDQVACFIEVLDAETHNVLVVHVAQLDNHVTLNPAEFNQSASEREHSAAGLGIGFIRIKLD
jgi:hypothetical protein